MEDDPHGLASAMAAGVIEAAGWRVMDLGSFSPAPMLAEQAHAQGADLVWVALGTTLAPELHRARLEGLARGLGKDSGKPVLVAGGPGYRGSPFPPPPGVHLIETLPQLDELARRLRQ
jgi:methylmalonyl-CoA mutase cobalamin-binding subunit